MCVCDNVGKSIKYYEVKTVKTPRRRKKLFRINSPVTFGILCALIVAMVGGGVFALAEGVIKPAIQDYEVNAIEPTPTLEPTPTPVVVTPDPALVQEAIKDGTFVTMDPNTGAIVKEEPTPTPVPTPEPTPTPMPLEGRVIAIDAGKSKGATHKGVSSHTLEYKINLAFAQALQEQLVSMGAKVVMTRESNSKQVGASSRISTINKANADLAISIFCNDVSKSEIRGAEAFVAKDAKNYDNSVKLARAIINGYTAATGMPVRDTDDGMIRIVTNKEVLSKAKVPIMGLVLGQLSNKTDDACLNDAAFIQKAARGMANGIKNYLG